MYETQKEFFSRLGDRKPRWLTSLQWRVLRCYFAPSIPCEPSDLQKFIENTASKLVRQAQRINYEGQAAMLAKQALESGLKKLKAKMAFPYPEVPPPDERSRYDLWQSGLTD